MDGHGAEKFKDAGLIATSATRSWTRISAELRAHSAGEIGAFTPQNGEITKIIRDTDEAVSVRSSGGVRQEVAATPTTTWLCPAGIREEATRLSADIPEVLHVYLPPHTFLTPMDDGLGSFRAQDLRYQARVTNPVIQAMLEEITRELRFETSSGGLRMDTLAIHLILALARDHAETGEVHIPVAPAAGALDRRRLDRVLGYINDRLDDPITVSDLAEVACVSLFHFARAFSLSMGMPPHAYLSERRLDRARHLLAYSDAALADIALTCGFSGQSSFTKAFTRSVGASPGTYRARATAH